MIKSKVKAKNIAEKDDNLSSASFKTIHSVTTLPASNMISKDKIVF